ncbi:hypothetical protein BH24ACT22_BH24ACT22_12110 [soil metagenome]
MQGVPDYLAIARRAGERSSDTVRAEGAQVDPTSDEDRQIKRLIAQGMSPEWARAEVRGWEEV